MSLLCLAIKLLTSITLSLIIIACPKDNINYMSIRQYTFDIYAFTFMLSRELVILKIVLEC
jgi:hypothetical protein